ncbi:fibronectin type III domain-containing protein [Dactylosporangium sp. CA-139066]|uniref:fibronectin type III domain-containing protein n=1 Tax=Dactylosporangium sp. CA-139066 TaxID=3239930 RepID=UPI003D90DA22
MAASDDALIDALGQYIGSVMGDSGANTPTVRYYLGTWAGAEASDSNLSQVILQGGTWCRFVPKKAHVTGLTAGNTVILCSSPTIPLHIDGILSGNISVATAVSNDSQPPTVPTSLTVGTVTTSSVALSWIASTDNIAVTAYDIFVNGVYKLSAITNSVTVTGLASSTAYTFTVRARDGAGNVSPQSDSVSATTSTPAAPPAGTVTSYTGIYPATWSRTYNNHGGNEWDSWYGSEAHQGQYSGDNERSLIGFDTAKIAADLAGGTPVAAAIRLTFFHWWANSGGTAVIGTHGYSSPPDTYSTQNPNRWQSAGWPRGGTRSVDLGASVCAEFQAGTSKGIILGPGPSSSTQYYGKAYGAGSGVYVPTLYLTYTRTS